MANNPPKIMFLIAALGYPASADASIAPLSRPGISNNARSDAETFPFNRSGFSPFEGLQSHGPREARGVKGPRSNGLVEALSALYKTRVELSDQDATVMSVTDALGQIRSINIISASSVRYPAPVSPVTPADNKTISVYLEPNSAAIVSKLISKRICDFNCFLSNHRDEGEKLEKAQQNTFEADIEGVWESLLNTASDGITLGREFYRIAGGGDFTSTSTFGYANLLYSGPERTPFSQREISFDGFLDYSGSGNQDTVVTNRVGGGFSIGNPSSIVATTDVGYYFFPSANDIAETLNFRLVRGGTNVLPANLSSLPRVKQSAQPVDSSLYSTDAVDAKVWDTNGDPKIGDHIRPGDIWLAASSRWLTSSDSNFTGTTLTGTLTIALPRLASHHKALKMNPALATTFSIGATYSQQHTLGCDEYSLEFRHPFAGLKRHENPLYLTTRYGTRGDVSVGFEYRFF